MRFASVLYHIFLLHHLKWKTSNNCIFFFAFRITVSEMYFKLIDLSQLKNRKVLFSSFQFSLSLSLSLFSLHFILSLIYFFFFSLLTKSRYFILTSLLPLRNVLKMNIELQGNKNTISKSFSCLHSVAEYRHSRRNNSVICIWDI